MGGLVATAYFVQMWEWASQKLPFRWRGAGLATFLFRGSKKKGGGGKGFISSESFINVLAMSNGLVMISVHCPLCWVHTPSCFTCTLYTDSLSVWLFLPGRSEPSFFLHVSWRYRGRPRHRGLKGRVCIYTIPCLYFSAHRQNALRKQMCLWYFQIKCCFLIPLPPFSLQKERLCKSNIFLLAMHSIVTSDMYLSYYALKIK